MTNYIPPHHTPTREQIIHGKAEVHRRRGDHDLAEIVLAELDRPCEPDLPLLDQSVDSLPIGEQTVYRLNEIGVTRIRQLFKYTASQLRKCGLHGGAVQRIEAGLEERGLRLR